MKERILVVDDEKLIVKGIKFSLEQEGMIIEAAYDGEEAINMAKDNKYDLILLDLMLPKISGLEVCAEIRKNSDVPIIMLTAKGEDMDKITGLECGADDYITKPFNILEVRARIKALIRRASIGTNVRKHIVVGDIKLDIDTKSAYIKDNEIKLTGIEFDILELLLRNVNKVYSREALLKHIWSENYHGDVRTVDVHVRRLREKIETNPSEPGYVLTKWGMGYYCKG